MSPENTIGYNTLIAPISSDFEILNKLLKQIFVENSTQLDFELGEYLFGSSKRIRSALIFLFARALNGKVCANQYNICAAIELIHNATLIHDDIIDNSETRRGMKALHSAFSNKLAVIAGDFLFSLGFQKITENNSLENLTLFAQTLKQLCVGEIDQYFNKGNITSIENYVEKSAKKTAALFMAGLVSAFSDVKNENLKSCIKKFAYNFGVAFQLKNDLDDFLKENLNNKFFNDISNGIYTAPVIFAYEENHDILHSDDIIAAVLRTNAVEKTYKLIEEYAKFAVDNLACVSDNVYKETLDKLCAQLYAR